ncbi:MAG: insulinase family protein [Deltaproteobacteria bacterium]|jgi:Zn-dependent M16 (insulinase) family peptidase|nr:insulinase family protein [Deltaproteobacteria bacterium]
MCDFTLVFEEEVPELGSRARLWRHEGCGAQLLSFRNRDENKVFGVALRTPPRDSTGLPHILEHSVLCGSDRYPVREPFVELLKGSLQTFLNAFTYPDKTCYPVASANLQDFYNLVSVYIDAVFHPRLSEEVFQQEGWHLEAEPGGGEPLFGFKGVVYNEMKGAFSSPESVLERCSLQALFPDTPYGLESGGDPERIPELTFADFLQFHRLFYHPGNARFFFWGDDPEEKRLEILEDLLRGQKGREAAFSGVPLQPAFSAPRFLRKPYAAGESDLALFTLNWALPENGPEAEKVELSLGQDMLEHILLGMPASPLRLALLESGLGEDISGGGLESELRQPVFSVGLKGMREEKAGAARDLILNTLEKLAREGVPPASVEAAVNSVEFELREKNTGRFPVGLAVMLRSLSVWLHSDNPEDRAAIAPLRFEAPLRSIKKKAGAGYFEELIRGLLLDNPHRADLLLYPDKNLGREQAEAEEERVRARLSGLGRKEKEALAEASKRLKLSQETPDSPEALASIPRLSPADLPLKNREIPQELPAGLPAPLYFHPQPTNGVCYLTLYLDAGRLPASRLPLLPLLGRAMLEMGNDRRGHIELNMEIAAKTGGLDTGLSIASRLDGPAPLCSFYLSGKAAPDKTEALFELGAELLLRTELDNREQFRRLLLEEKARLEHSLAPSGHMLAVRRLRASLSPSGLLDEITGGVSYLERVRRLCGQALEDWPGLLRELLETREEILNAGRARVCLTAEEDMLPRLAPLAEGLLLSLPSGVSRERPEDSAEAPAPRPSPPEALLIPAQVSYAARGVNLFAHGYVYHGSALVILKYLRTGYLWEKIRVQGGAYGALCGLDRGGGDFFLASYRDPDIRHSLSCFEACAGHLLRRGPERAELEAAIVGAVGELDAYLLPEAKGTEAYFRVARKDTPELRARLREEVLGTGPEDFRRFGEALAEAMPSASSAALGGDALAEYARPAGWKLKRIL